MRMTYMVHILAGTLGLLSGFTALYTGKGAPLHRRAGMLFVYTMLPMAVFGLIIAAGRGIAPALNLPAGLLTAYLVVTGLATVRPPATWFRGFHLGGLALALGVGIVSLMFGAEAVAGGGMRKGMPAFPFFMFGTVGMLAAAGDMRVLRSGALRGPARLARHLWRMCFALFVAALSFFIGQRQVFPEAIRIMPLLALPVLAVLVTMFYWLWRVRVRRSLRGLRVATSAEAA
jgi:hypothetical protein